MGNQLDIELADCKHFKWMAGMLTLCGARIRKGWLLDNWVLRDEFPPVPDIKDPATKGCLLALIRSLTKDAASYVAEFDDGWAVCTWPEPENQQYYPTEEEALAHFIINH